MLRALVLVVASGSLVVGCAKAKQEEPAAGPGSVAPAPPPPAEPPPPPPEPPPEPTAPPPADPAAFDFAKLSHDDKVKFMKQQVMPAMKPLFQKFDKKAFASVTCKTCHGKEPAKKKYEMPNDELPALDFAAIKAGKEDPRMLEFMEKRVKPKMAELLGRDEMSDSKPDGFGCLGCHVMKK
jgi:hypothetical protein